MITDMDVENTTDEFFTASKQEPGIARKDFPAFFVKSIDEERRRIVAVASTASIDLHGEVIEPEAFREGLKAYMRNPVVLACHSHRLLDGRSSIVANVVDHNLSKRGLIVVVEFHCKTELSREYWALYKCKAQRAFSVGFTPEKGGKQDVDGKRVYVHTKVLLHEISCVAVGANPDALSKAKQRKRDFVQRQSRKSKAAAEYTKQRELEDMYLAHEGSGRYEKERRAVLSGLDENASEYAEMIAEGPHELRDEDYACACVRAVNLMREQDETIRKAVEGLLELVGYIVEDGGVGDNEKEFVGVFEGDSDVGHETFF